MFEFNKKGAPEQGSEAVARDPQPAAPAPAPEVRSSAPAAPAAPTPRAAPGGRRDTATIGPSIQVDGQLRGEEDLYVEGQVSGTVHLESHTLTIGSQGKVMADVYAHTIYVDGTVEGDLYGAEQVIIRRNAHVRGNVTSPRVSLEDGATFKGSIEMDPEAVKAAIKPGAARTAPPASGGRPAQGQASGQASGQARPATPGMAAAGGAG